MFKNTESTTKQLLGFFWLIGKKLYEFLKMIGSVQKVILYSGVDEGDLESRRRTRFPAVFLPQDTVGKSEKPSVFRYVS